MFSCNVFHSIFAVQITLRGTLLDSDRPASLLRMLSQADRQFCYILVTRPLWAQALAMPIHPLDCESHQVLCVLLLPVSVSPLATSDSAREPEHLTSAASSLLPRNPTLPHLPALLTPGRRGLAPSPCVLAGGQTTLSLPGNPLTPHDRRSLMRGSQPLCCRPDADT